MPTTVNIQSTFSYGYLPLFILLILLFSPLIAKRVKARKLKAKAKEEMQKPDSNYKPIELSVKQKYVKELNGIRRDFLDKKRDERDCYQLLSYFLREFFKEYAGVDVSNKTLAEIRGLGSSKLTKLIEEYYECEFAPDKSGDVEGIVEKTIDTIEHW